MLGKEVHLGALLSYSFLLFFFPLKPSLEYSVSMNYSSRLQNQD